MGKKKGVASSSRRDTRPSANGMALAPVVVRKAPKVYDHAVCGKVKAMKEVDDFEDPIGDPAHHAAMLDCKETLEEFDRMIKSFLQDGRADMKPILDVTVTENDQTVKDPARIKEVSDATRGLIFSDGFRFKLSDMGEIKFGVKATDWMMCKSASVHLHQDQNCRGTFLVMVEMNKA